MSKKQNEIAIKAQRGLEEEKKKNINHNNRMIMGSFDRQVAIKMIIFIFMHQAMRFLIVSLKMLWVHIKVCAQLWLQNQV